MTGKRDDFSKKCLRTHFNMTFNRIILSMRTKKRYRSMTVRKTEQFNSLFQPRAVACIMPN